MESWWNDWWIPSRQERILEEIHFVDANVSKEEFETLLTPVLRNLVWFMARVEKKPTDSLEAILAGLVVHSIEFRRNMDPGMNPEDRDSLYIRKLLTNDRCVGIEHVGSSESLPIDSENRETEDNTNSSSAVSIQPCASDGCRNHVFKGLQFCRRHEPFVKCAIPRCIRRQRKNGVCLHHYVMQYRWDSSS